MGESKPRLLDLFSGAGGAACGYQRAGFYVVGVDHHAQPRYCGDEFVQWDALEALDRLLAGETLEQEAMGYVLLDFDAIHASPPCQRYSKLAAMHPGRDYPDLIEPVRERLQATGLPWVIENVEGAPLATHPTLDGLHGVVLCGSMFGLGVDRGELRRHRVFESNVSLGQPSCSHQRPAVGVYGHGGHSGKHRMLYRAEAAEAMQIDWQTRDEMTQAIPPAYTELIGYQLLTYLRNRDREVA